jgi:radical SAM protein with 4Fe4S-binding SPASM domain
MQASKIKDMKSVGLRKLRTAKYIIAQKGWRAAGHLARKKLDNLVLHAYVQHINPEQGLKYPKALQIEVSSNCNLRCPSCSLSREVNPGRNITPDEVRAILDRLPFSPESISLNGIGEPLINPRFFEIVDILAERKIMCSFFTNGTMLTPRIREAILSRQNIVYVGISCDGAQKSTFEILRYGAKFETWKQFVGAFLESAHQRQPQPIQTSMSTVVSKQNLYELAGIMELAAGLGFRSIHFADVMPNDDVAAQLALSDEEWAACDVQNIINRGTEKGIAVSFNYRRSAKPPQVKLRCLQPWEYSMISAEGDVHPCCAIVGSDEAPVMGNIRQQDFQSIWNGDPFKSFRRATADGNNELCKKCPYY